MVGGWQRGTHLVNGKEGSRASMETGRRSKQLSSPETMGEKTEKKKRKGTEKCIEIAKPIIEALKRKGASAMGFVGFYWGGKWNIWVLIISRLLIPHIWVLKPSSSKHSN
ncbi:uncharacterized protein HKW66_Vig0114750 [Vigna angularis]|uniref:Uncharacterized protein n=1 Tax=Phaseolus angularis TaxID=3914 RepID=A0A8T0L2C6_PHAAN|nr:uncharacterized protein HKW66_Vig0114750 [Vigna angularis]